MYSKTPNLQNQHTVDCLHCYCLRNMHLNGATLLWGFQSNLNLVPININLIKRKLWVMYRATQTKIFMANIDNYAEYQIY